MRASRQSWNFEGHHGDNPVPAGLAEHQAQARRMMVQGILARVLEGLELEPEERALLERIAASREDPSDAA